MTEPTQLYRHFDGQGRLLYVGISLDALTRLGEHRANSAWFDRITRVEIQRHPTREGALEAEQIAIWKEKPECNIQHTVRPPPPKVVPLHIIREFRTVSGRKAFVNACGECGAEFVTEERSRGRCTTCRKRNAAAPMLEMAA